jgi:hypothetical protein
VEARDFSHVVAWDSSHVEARDSSHVEAWDSSAIHVKSDYSTVDLFSFAVAILVAANGSRVRAKSKTATIVRPPERSPGIEGWLEDNAIEPADKVVLYKRVSGHLKTQEGMSNETAWLIGRAIEHPSWNPDEAECGSGKFHAVSRPFFGNEFRSEAGDRYIAIEVAIVDMHAWPTPKYPHKIAFRRGTVLYECDRYGKRIGGES